MIISECKSCKASILWVVMAKSGKANPLDAEPCEKGNIHVYEDGQALVLNKDVIAKMRERFPETPLYLSHFSTCPNSRQHRKPA